MMTDMEKTIWTNVYSWHMANFQKRFEFDTLPTDKDDYHCQESIDWADDAILALRRNQHHLTDEVKGMLFKSNTARTSVGLDRLDEVILRGT
jgi:hypothetical protein